MVAWRKDREDESPARPARAHLRLVVDQPLPLVRRDTLPEHTDYRDTGCAVAPRCLRCPLPRCRYEEPRPVRGVSTLARDREIALLRRRHRAPIKLLAGAYGLDPRTIFRILREQQ